MMVFGASDHDTLPPRRRLSASVEGPIGRGRGRGTSSPPVAVSLVLGNFQGAVVIDMGLVKVGEGKSATLRIEAPESARRPVTSIGVDPKHPPAGGLEVSFNGELSLARGEFHEAMVTWVPEAPGKFRGNLAFRVDSRFPAQVSVVGEAFDIGAGKGRKADVREGRKRVKGPGGGARAAGRRSLSQEGSGRADPHTSVYGKENRLSLGSAALPSASVTALSSSTPALGQGTTNKRQQMLKYSASRRLSLKPPPRRGKPDACAPGGAGGGADGESKAALMRKALHDKGWAEKQAAGFTTWLNFNLVGAEQMRHGGDADGGGDDGEMEGFAREAGGVSSSPLKAMFAMRHEARQRMRAMRLFRSVEIRDLCDAVADRAHDGTISLRRDRVLHADVGLSGALVDLVLCYESRWLLVGLETVFGEIIPVPASAASRAGRVERALRTFVTERLVKCPDIKARYGFRGRMASGRSEMEYNDELSRHALTHFLDLVLFLDRAKTENLLHPCPCLFRKTAEVKSSAGMLKVFCQFLHGEGDFVRHLKKMGYVVGHVQSYIDEFDFHVGNLAVDLRDGVRLTRLVEVVTGEWGLAVGLRVPAVSRLQKIFNTGKALQRLERDGALDTTTSTATATPAITPKVIVDGDQHATLHLLWSVIARYSLSTLLDRDALAREAEGVVSAARKWRRAGFSPDRHGRVTASVGSGNSGGGDGEPPSPGCPASPASPPPSAGRAVAGEEHPPLEMPDVEAVRCAWGLGGGEGSVGGGAGEGRAAGRVGGRDQDLLSALLVWCQAVCHGYGVPVRNFTTSFADGRALCLLLHYYHPRILSLNAIRRTTAHLPRIGGGQGELEDWSASLDLAKITEADCKAALDGERANVALARRCVSELGGVPSMLAPFDSTNRPEEKTIITVVAHLCARLLESSAEIRSTILVQRSYRSYLERTGRGDLVQRARAAKAQARARAAAERAARAMAMSKGSVAPMTPPPRRNSVAAANGRRLTSAVASPGQMMLVSEKQQAHLAAVAIQRWWAVASVERLRKLGAAAAATTVQAVWRGQMARAAVAAERVERQEEQRIGEAAARIQAAVRGRSERNAFLVSRNAALVVQAWVRGRLQRSWYVALQSQMRAAVRLQTVARGAAARRLAANVRGERQIQLAAAAARKENNAAITIQAWGRLLPARAKFLAVKRATTLLQAAARGRADAALFRKRCAAIITIQAWRRGTEARARLAREKIARAARAERESTAAAVKLQAFGRGVLARITRRRIVGAVTVAQARVRGRAARALAAERRGAVALLQRRVRGAVEARRYGRLLVAACVVQAWGRGVVARRDVAERRAAAVRLQAWARGAMEGARFRRCLAAVVALQALQRGVVARGQAAERRGAAVCLQAWRRGTVVRVDTSRRNRAAVRVQAWARARIESRKFRETVNAVVVLQTRWRGAAAAARYLETIAAAKTIQARWRGAAAVARYRRDVNAVVTVQARWRGAVVAARYRKTLSAAVVIQVRWRGAAAVALYRSKRVAALTIQTAWRASRAKRDFARNIDRVTRLQAWWRAVACRMLVCREQRSATKLQAAWRGLAARVTRNRAIRGAVRLQALTRGVQTRARLQQERREAAARDAALREAAVRRAQAAAVVLQMWQRGRMALRRRLELERVISAEKLAAATRLAATIKMQAVARGIVARRALRATVAAATVVQAYFRGRRARAQAVRRSAAAVKIQSAVRVASALALVEEMRAERRAVSAAVSVQALWRGTAVRAVLSRRKIAAITMQRWWRAIVEKAHVAAVLAAAEAREAAILLSATVTLQACIRGHLSRAAGRRQAEAAAVIQSRWRGALERATLAQHAAATVRMQSFVRAAMIARSYRRSRAAVTVVQAFWRGTAARARIAAVEAELQAAREHGAAVTLQALARGRPQRSEFRRVVAAAAVLRGAWRKRVARRKRERSRALSRAAMTVQAWWRMVLARAELSRVRIGTVAFQAVVRGRVVRRAGETERAASSAISAWWRAVREERRFRSARAGIVALQSLVRGRRGRQEVAARWLALGRRFSKHKAATIIQAAVRGMAVRRSSGPRLAVARARIAVADARARADPSLILGIKVNDALTSLERGTHLTSIIRACIALELTSRYSKVCCEVMAESRCPQVLYDLVRGLNRSPPHQKILKYTITTFRNIVQRGEHLPALIAAPPVAAETYVDLLQMYRDRQEVFLPTVRLLQQLVTVHRPTKDACNLPKHAQRLESVRDILERKALTEAKSSAARAGSGSGRSARSLKAVQGLMDELVRD